LTDLFKVLKAVGLSSLLIALSLFMFNRLEGYPRFVLLIDGILTLMAIGGVRVFIRLFFPKFHPMSSPLPAGMKNRRANVS
jgi:hypothetical protein